MKAYPHYKESGIECFGEMPSHWDIKRLKHIASCNDDVVSEKTNADFEFEYVDIGSVSKLNGIEKAEKMVFEDAPSRARRKAQSGDVIVSTVRTYLQAITAITEEQSEYVYSTGFAVIRPKLVGKKFMQFALKDDAFLYQVMRESTGVSYPAINSNNLMNLCILLPPHYEQETIAKFLQKETAKIDNLIAEKQRFITLLEEKRQALISHVVTKGLDDKVEMKDSGVEWIGAVPKHWEGIQLKHCMKGGFQNGVFKKSDEFGDGTLLINVSDVFTEDNEIHVNRLDRVTATKAELKKYLVEYGDIFFIRSSLKLEGIGMTACFLDNSTTEPVIFECHVVKGRPNTQKVLPEYLIKVLHSHQLRYQQIRNSTTTTMTTISQAGLGSALLFLPPIEEQRKIIKYIDDNIKKIDALNSETRRSISLLKEHRSALISAAVTGKIDVREEV